MKHRRLAGLLAAVVAISLLAAACGDDKGDSNEGGSTTGATGSGATAAPTKGGVITVGQFSAAPGLDPAVLAGGGTVGANENAALYDTLMRYNNETQKYEGRTALSMEPNADASEWTMKIRPGIKFTDGTDYNADAVKFVLDREMKDGNASPKGQLLNFLDPATSVTVIDSMTLKFKLIKPWTGFPYVFTGVAGLIYSPTQFKKVNDPKAFAINPGDAGAGPFKFKSYKPGESIELERNPNYWGGDVLLDGLKFILLPGPAATYEALKAGTLQAGFVRDPATIAKAKAEKFGSVDMPAIGGNMAIMNSGIEITCAGGKPETTCAGKPDGEKVKSKTATSNVNVRRAVAAAIDPKVINDRVYEGKAQPNSAPFANSPWDPKVEGPKYDPTEAKRLIALAKTEGWDGKIRVLAGSDTQAVAWAQAMATQLTAVGMDVAVDTSKDTSGVVNQVLVLRDFDLATWALGWLDESDVNYLQLIGSFNTKNPRYGYANPDLEAAIDLLRVADTQEKRVAAYKRISEIWAKDDPGLVTTVIPQAMLYSPKVHGLVRTGQSITLFDKAYVDK
ncbi:MAG TPA: ABC transporter substrate-binding protein [Acidimicrobiales bacterium]|nr:ABC transporter substrate-binding protein [Acidimicrobiales bacterium]